MPVILSTQDERDQLIDGLLKRPDTGFQLPIIGTLCTISKGLLFYKVVVDEWPNFTTVLLRPDPEHFHKMPQYFHARHHVYTTNGANMQELFDSPGVLNWDKPIRFLVFPLKLLGHLEQLAKKNKGRIHRQEQSGSKIYSDYTVPDAELRIHEDFTLKDISEHLAEFMNLYWKYSYGDVTLDYIRFAIKHFSGPAVFDKQGDIVGIGLDQYDGSSGMGWVREDCRGKKLIKILSSEARGRRQKHHWHPSIITGFGYVAVQNEAASRANVRMARKIYDDEFSWIDILPLGYVSVYQRRRFGMAAL